MKKKSSKSEKVKASDILLPGARLIAFTIKDNEETKELIKETTEKQNKVLKLKEVNEERLRRVIKL